jgi:hypothetical protein
MRKRAQQKEKAIREGHYRQREQNMQKQGTYTKEGHESLMRLCLGKVVADKSEERRSLQMWKITYAKLGGMNFTFFLVRNGQITEVLSSGVL